MAEVYILSQRIDLFGDRIVANFAANELGKVEERNGVYTQTFNAPLTNKNKLIYENAQHISSATMLPYEMVEARIEEEGVPVVWGFAKLIQAGDTLEIYIIGGNANWFTLIGEDKMNEMDLLSLNHKWEDPQVYGRRSNTWTLGGLYPNADWGLVTTAGSTTITHDKLYYSPYCKYLLQELFSDIGFTLTGNFYSTNSLLEKMILPFAGQWKRDKRYEYRDRFSFEVTANTFATNADTLEIPGIFGTNGDTTTTCDYDFKPSKDYPITGLITSDSEGHWLMLDGGEITFNYNITVVRGANPPVDILSKIGLAYLDANGNQDGTLIADLSATPAGSTHVLTGTITATIGRGPMYITIGNLTIQAGSTCDCIIVPNDEDENDLFIDEYFTYITVGSTLPDITKIDFLRTIWNQFGIIFTTDPQTGYIKIFTISEVYGNLINATDWSSKLDRSKTPSITFEVGEYGQKNYFKYAFDSTDIYAELIPTYGEGYFSIDNANLPTRVDIFESVFAPTQRILSFNDARTMAYIPKFIDGENNDCEPRIAYVEFDVDNNITIGINATEPIQPNVYFDALKFQNLIYTYYPGLVSLLTKAKKITCWIRLNAIDIATLDLSKPVYIEYFENYFYINSINQYDFDDAGASTEVELIRL